MTPASLVYKLIGGLVAVLMLVILTQNRNHWKAKATELQHQLDAISTKRNEQKQTTDRNVEKVVQESVQVRTVVKHIHDAPKPEDCGTPDLSTLRNAL